MNPAWTKVKYKYSYHFTSIGKLHVSTYTRIIIRVGIKTLLDSSRPPSDCVRRTITGSIFMKFGIWVFFSENLSRNVKIDPNLKRITGARQEDACTFVISLWSIRGLFGNKDSFAHTTCAVVPDESFGVFSRVWTVAWCSWCSELFHVVSVTGCDNERADIKSRRLWGARRDSVFLQAENFRPSEIHRRLVAVYGEHVMNAASVGKWCIMFTNGRTNVHDAERSGRPYE